MFQGNYANNQLGDSVHSTAVGEQDTQTTHSALDKTGRTLDWCNMAFLKLTQTARTFISQDQGRYLCEVKDQSLLSHWSCKLLLSTFSRVGQ